MVRCSSAPPFWKHATSFIVLFWCSAKWSLLTLLLREILLRLTTAALLLPSDLQRVKNVVDNPRRETPFAHSLSSTLVGLPAWHILLLCTSDLTRVWTLPTCPNLLSECLSLWWGLLALSLLLRCCPGRSASDPTRSSAVVTAKKSSFSLRPKVRVRPKHLRHRLATLRTGTLRTLTSPPDIKRSSRLTGFLQIGTSIMQSFFATLTIFLLVVTP